MNPIRNHIKGLDGLRALAVLLVLGTHSRWGWDLGGWMGVDIFFVISGYLITWQLISRKSTFRSFMRRRLARLWPALICVCVLVLAISVIGHEPVRPILNVVTYTAGLPVIGASTRNRYLWQTWTLMIEMQFYVVWAAFLLTAVRCRHRILVGVSLGLAVASFGTAVVFAASGHLPTAYSATPATIYGLLVGAALAAAGRLPHHRFLLIVAGVATTALLPFADMRTAPGLLICAPIATLFAAAFIAEAVDQPQSRLIRLAEHPAARWIGIRSYSLYLWHVPVFEIFEFRMPGPEPVVQASMWALTFAFAAVSYTAIERPARLLLTSTRPSVRPDMLDTMGVASR
jgi:peptidoglycan/LPS O-acetylase OafA/YrhL